jgi:hypothetical protein
MTDFGSRSSLRFTDYLFLTRQQLAPRLHPSAKNS